MQFQALMNLSDIEAISGEWAALLDRSACNRAFGSPAWCLSAFRTSRASRPYVILARRGPAIASVFPLAITENGKEAVSPALLADYNDIICERDDLSAAAETLAYAVRGSRPYERLNLWRVRGDSNCVRALETLGVGQDGFFHREGHYSYIHLPATYDEFLASKSRNFRKSVRRALQRAADHGVAVRELNADDLCPSLVPRIFLSLHLERVGENSVFRRFPENNSFVRMALPLLFAEGRMRIFGIEVAGKIVAIDMTMVAANGLCTWNGGYAPEAAPWSPGRLLLAAGINKACALGYEEYDLLRGVQDWKARWANRIRDVGRLQIPVNSLHGAEPRSAD
jgi:CelD/BcsL family acetyltransferase involved in cellulose biosynthesis